MSNTPNLTNPTTWALDREIVLVRVLDATRDAVFAAWTDADAFCQWFGPDGYACTVREMDVRPGGRACFDMVSPDGTVFTNRFEADGKTVLTLRQLHPTVEQRDAGVGFGAVELGLQTMRKLAHHLGVA